MASRIPSYSGMDSFETYLSLAERPNTRRSYASAIRHFEVEWRGLLPATPEMIARYLAEYAASLSINTLKSRLAGLSRWHTDHGFTDPTKSPLVSQILKGIRVAHNVPEKQARPLELLQLQQVTDWLGCKAATIETDTESREGHGDFLRHHRDQAMLLIGFWRGFRADELTRLSIENISVESGKGLTCYLPYSKGDRASSGRSYRCPALSRLCPVAAYEKWLAVSRLTAGPVFRRIDQWGHLATTGISPGSVVPWLRRLFDAAGIEASGSYSSHSLRRGFAGWADASGWDLKELMAYVGWKDFHSAIRYLDPSGNNLNARFEQGLAPSVSASTESTDRENAPDAGHGREKRSGTPKLRVVK